MSDVWKVYGRSMVAKLSIKMQTIQTQTATYCQRCDSLLYPATYQFTFIVHISCQIINLHFTMERSMLLTLPNEILVTLIEYVDSPSYTALAQTCQTLNLLTTPHLYKSANIQLGKSNEFVRTVKTKHADLVRHVAVVIENDKLEISPCRIVPCLEKLENLLSLTLAGGYWMWDTEEENWDTLEDCLWEYFERASLKQPGESRVARSLRSCTSLTSIHKC
jgi:hypothetical protein